MDNELILQMIRSGKAEREKAIRHLLNQERIVQNIRQHIKSNQGTEEDAKSILNFTLVQFMKKVLKEKDFVITSSLPNYLTGIAKFLWLAELRKKAKGAQSLSEHYELQDESTSIDLQIINEERKQNLTKLLSQLGKKCKEVLMYWSYGHSMREIANLVDYSSEGVVRKKKFTCMQELRKYIADHPSLIKDLRF